VSNIKVGDLVVVVKCGCTDRNLGFTFTAIKISDYEEISTCIVCGLDHGVGRFIYPDSPFPSGKGLYIRESRLRRIPPLSELNDTKKETETTG
jgi:hypothetical protein